MEIDFVFCKFNVSQIPTNSSPFKDVDTDDCHLRLFFNSIVQFLQVSFFDVKLTFIAWEGEDVIRMQRSNVNRVSLLNSIIEDVR